MSSACEKLGGKVKENVCFVDNFPTHVNYKDWWGESGVPDALRYNQAIVLHMTPDDAKKLFPPISYTEERVQVVQDRIEQGLPINPPWLSICLNHGEFENETWIVGHEGRHRIEAARRSGLSRIPVILKEREGQFCVPRSEL